MTEVKGTLLGIILLLAVFSAVAVTVASVYTSSKEEITDRRDAVMTDALIELGEIS